MGEHGRGRGERGGGGGGASTTTAPNPPPQAKPHPNPPPRNESFLSSRPTKVTTGRSPGPKSPTPPPPPPPPHGLRRPSPPPNPPTPPRPPPQNPPPHQDRHPQGAEKKDARPEDPIVGTVVHVPDPAGVERGTVRGIHGRKYGAVWVEYPGGTTLYKVNRSLLFPTLEEAERLREEAWGAGKKKAKLPTPTNEVSNPPNANPTTEPTNPTNPTNPPSGPTKMWDPTTGSHEV